MTRSASPAWSRDCSSLHVSVTIPATFRLGTGNALAGTPDGASPSWYPAATVPGGDRMLSRSRVRVENLLSNAPSRGGPSGAGLAAAPADRPVWRDAGPLILLPPPLSAPLHAPPRIHLATPTPR